MFPLKTLMDYIEMDRLLSTCDNDVFNIPTYTQLSPFSTPTGNRSSSSAESISMDPYFDSQQLFRCAEYSQLDKFEDQLFRNRPSIDPFFDSQQLFRRSEYSQQDTLDDSLFRHRPIVGRRLTMNEPTTEGSKFYSTWKKNEIKPLENNIFNENKSDSIYYELFPKTNSSYSSISEIPSPNLSNVANVGPDMSYSLPEIQYSAPLLGHTLVPSTSKQNSNKICTFCRKNGETPLVYMTHVVKQKVGRNEIVTCPILRSHVCNTCGATGDKAHTITYCPVLRRDNKGKPLLSTTVTLKNTRVKSNGQRRF